LEIMTGIELLDRRDVDWAIFRALVGTYLLIDAKRWLQREFDLFPEEKG